MGGTAMRAVILTALIEGDILALYTPRADDLILCADGGYTYAQKAGVTPHKVIGDFDSLPQRDIAGVATLRVPKEKDDTDTMLCIRYALDYGCDAVLLLGGMGGRLDHTIANLQSLAFACAHGMGAEMRDVNERVLLLENEARALPRENAAISLFSYSGRCEGVSIKGVQYPLHNATLENAFPLGVSNAFSAPIAELGVQKGLLLVVLSKLR